MIAKSHRDPARTRAGRAVFWRAAAGALMLAFALAVWPGSAAAQVVPCGEHERVLAQLFEKYAEERSGYGVTHDGNLLELVVGPEGSWTLLLTRPGGLTCMVTSGEGWRHLIPPSKDPLT